MRWVTRINKRRRGFTLVELMIVVIIVGILAAAAVPIYSALVKRAYSTEAKATVGGIRAAEQIYWAEKSDWLVPTEGGLTTADVLKTLGIDLSQNRWFNETNSTITFGNSFGSSGADPGVQIAGNSDTTVKDVAAHISFKTGELYYCTDYTTGPTWKLTG